MTMTAWKLVDWLRERLPKEPKFPSGPEHEPCERGRFCRECASMVADEQTRENMERLLARATEELQLEERREIFEQTT